MGFDDFENEKTIFFNRPQEIFAFNPEVIYLSTQEGRAQREEEIRNELFSL